MPDCPSCGDFVEDCPERIGETVECPGCGEYLEVVSIDPIELDVDWDDDDDDWDDDYEDADWDDEEEW